MQHKSRLHEELLAIIRQYVQTPADTTRKSKVGQRTIAIRMETIFGAFRDLQSLGYKLQSAHNLREKHAHALGRHWEAEGQSPGTIENKISVLRTFAKWIGKPNMIKATVQYVERPESARRTYATTVDKTWTGNGQEPETVIGQVKSEDIVVGVQLALQHVFGMRRRESWMFRPHLDDKGTHIAIILGTKNKRPRSTPIETDAQREVLEHAKQFADKVDASTIPPSYTLLEWENHYTYILRKCGITRAELGITSHGLRHEYVNEQWEILAGSPSPIKGGEKGALSEDEELRVRHELSQRVGHSRASVVSAYSSSHTALQRAKNKSNETLEAILKMRQQGITNNAEIGRRLGITRQAVWKSLSAHTALERAESAGNKDA